MECIFQTEITLKAWQTRNGREDRVFTWYEVIKTPTAQGAEPYTAGYIAVI